MHIVEHGGIPNPVGGITVHVHRLAQRLQAVGVPVRVYDRTGDRTTKDVKKLDPTVAIEQGWPGLIRCVLDRRAIHHVHVSAPRGVRLVSLCLILAVLPRRRTCLTFHSGTFPAYLLQHRGAALILRFLRWRAACWFALNDSSERAVASVPSRNATVRTSSHIRLDPLAPAPDVRRTALPACVEAAVARGHRLVLTSGYCVANTRIADVVAAAQRSQAAAESSLAVVAAVYGDRDPAEYARLVALRDAGRLILLEDCPPEAFAAVLAASDLYVRHTVTDAFGLAVAEAIDAGVPAIATDTCQRAEGCTTYPADDPAALDRLISDRLISRRERIVVARSHDEFDTHLTAYRDVAANADRRNGTRTHTSVRSAPLHEPANAGTST